MYVSVTLNLQLKLTTSCKQKLLTETAKGDILQSRVETMLEFWCYVLLKITLQTHKNILV